MHTDRTEDTLDIFTLAFRALFFVFVVLLQCFDNVEIVTAFVTFEFVDGHSVREWLPVYCVIYCLLFMLLICINKYTVPGFSPPFSKAKYPPNPAVVNYLFELMIA